MFMVEIVEWDVFVVIFIIGGIVRNMNLVNVLNFEKVILNIEGFWDEVIVKLCNVCDF